MVVMADTRRLPGPNADLWDWQLKGLCRGMDSAFFFHPDGERGPARARREARAKAVCERCPVLTSCRKHALAVQEPYGIWGGMSESERDAVVKSRKRQLTITPLLPAPRTSPEVTRPTTHPTF
jgi:WhiB family redox-sensing transcriptional regulator